MLFHNPRAEYSPYPNDLAPILNVASVHESQAWMACWQGIEPCPTPLFELPALAA